MKTLNSSNVWNQVAPARLKRSKLRSAPRDRHWPSAPQTSTILIPGGEPQLYSHSLNFILCVAVRRILRTTLRNYFIE